ncbi:MAG: cytochrome d ubiquinol oxidase subunit II [Ilumatobacteraceae bacterium]|nr:cytochrome d ubiquinol oxidase subunit II [Ilumatobacteraceae bacterium]
MTLVRVVISVVWVGVIAYAVFGGADFGSGFWDLLAGGDRQGARPRRRIERSIGPVWEANHVWLIFVLVYLWTGFPDAFAAIATTLYVPLFLAAAGIVFRGGSFVFRKSSTTLGEARFFGALFALSSVITPFFFGAAVGGVASGRVPAEGNGDPWSSWINPASLLGGVLAVAVCAWTSAVLLTSDAHRDGEADLTAYFRRRALVTGFVVGAIALVGVVAIETDADTLASGLHGRALALVLLSAACGLAAMWLLHRDRPSAARLPAAGAVVAIVVGWGVGQYPWMLVDQVTIDQAAAPPATLWALLVAFAGAALLVVPALIWMLVLTDEGRLEQRGELDDSSQAVLDRLQASAGDATR